MAAVLRNLGWAFAIFGGVGALLVYSVSHDAAWKLFAMSAAIAALSFLVSTALDVAARDDLARPQKGAWLVVIALGLPPVGALLYFLLGRRRTATWFTAPRDDADAPRELPWRHAAPDPFHRQATLTPLGAARDSAPGSAPRTPPPR